jgi:hypothetical protein
MSRFLPRTAVLALLAAATLAACSSGGDSSTALPSGPTLTTTAAPTTAAPATSAAPTAQSSLGTQRSPIRWLGPTASGTGASVQEATRAYWSMVVRLAEKPDPDDPDIAALSVEPQTDQLATLFRNTRDQGLSQRGPIDGSVTVGKVSGAAAAATTCLDQRLTRVYDKAGKQRPGSSGLRTQYAMTLKQVGGTWKVATVSGGSETCTVR